MRPRTRNKKKPLYDSSRKREDYTFHPKRRFELSWDTEPGDCHIYVLSERQASMLRKMVQVFPVYHWVWGLSSSKRNWDTATQTLWGEIENFVKETEACLVSDCNATELTKAVRQLTAVVGGQSVDFTQPIPDQVDYSAIGAGIHPMIHEHLQSLGPIPKAGDTIMTSLQKLANEVGTGLTLDDAILEIQTEIGNDPGYDYKDYLEMLTFMKQLLPVSAGGFALSSIFQLIATWREMRYKHNDLSLKALQAQNLRSIANAITAFEPDGIEDEESIYKSTVDEIDKYSWLGTTIFALVDPSPAGETALAVKLGLVAVNAWAKIKSLWDKWSTDYLGAAKPKTLPNSTVAGELAKMREMWGEFDPESIKDIVGAISGSVSNISVNCSSCGSSGGCSCASSGGATGTNIPDIPDHVEGDPIPPEFDPASSPVGSQEYIDRKCKMANLIHETAVDFVTRIEAKFAEILTAKSLLRALATATTLSIVSATLGEVLTPVPLLDAVIVGVIGFSLAIAIYLLDNDFVFAPLLAAFTNRNDDLICALYNSTSIVDARNEYVDILDQEGVNLVTRNLVGEIMAGGLLMYLFADWSGTGEAMDAALTNYNPSYNCLCENSCILGWQFVSSAQDFTFNDQSIGGATAVGGHSVPNEALEVLHFLPDTSAISSVNEMKSEILPADLTVSEGDTFGVTMGATSDGQNSQVTIQVHYDDLTTESVAYVYSTQTTFNLTLTGVGKGVRQLEVTTARSTGAGSNGSTHYARVLDVQLTLSSPTNCPGNYPLA